MTDSEDNKYKKEIALENEEENERTPRSPNIKDKPNVAAWFKKNPDAQNHFNMTKEFLLKHYSGDNHGFVNKEKFPEYKFNSVTNRNGVYAYIRAARDHSTVRFKISEVSKEFNKFFGTLKNAKGQSVNWVTFKVAKVEDLEKINDFLTKNNVNTFDIFGEFSWEEFKDSMHINLDNESLLDDIKKINESNSTEKEALIKARLGQGKFRKDLMEKWGEVCCVSGVENVSILKASHIKPWVESNDEERLNPDNGLLLNPTYDALFDKGYISFENDGKIVFSDDLSQKDRLSLGLSDKDHIAKDLNKEQKRFLEYHRKEVFIA